MKLGVLISGRGSNLQALIDACAAPDYPARIAVVISNKPDAAGLDRAAAAGLTTQVVDHRGFGSKAAFEDALNDALLEHTVDLVCLAGFMRLLSAPLVEKWRDRMINIHPSLLPAFRGLDTHEKALAAGVRVHGCTVHFVRPEMDVGPILLQAVVPVLGGDDPERLAARVLAQEHIIYPEAVRLIAQGRTKVVDERVEIDGLPQPPGLA
ncbi:MAG: phosphoribosylglycinamide formyltransferase [Alphaproteobacteria bacterium]|nr:phosphoribosylglycinamide formyltransferase [Alphaproteobacteria bacterium]